MAQSSSRSEANPSEYPASSDVYQLETLFNHLENSTTPKDNSTLFSIQEQTGNISGYISELNEPNVIPSHSGNEKDDEYEYFSNRISSSVPSSSIDHLYNDNLVHQQFSQLLQQQQHQQQAVKIPQHLPHHHPLGHPVPQPGVQPEVYEVQQQFSPQHQYAQNGNPQYLQQFDVPASNPQTLPQSSPPQATSFPQRPQSIRQQSLPIHPTKHGIEYQIKEIPEDAEKVVGFDIQLTYYNNPQPGQFKSPKIAHQLYSRQPQHQQHQAQPQHIKDSMGLPVKSLRPDEIILKDIKTKAKRGRPKKNRNPGFHIKLDGINKKPILGQRIITSSQSDSGADYWSRTPGGHRIPSSLAFTPAHTSFRDDTDSHKYMQFSENELELTDDALGMSIPSFNITPSMEPPARVSGYFDIANTQPTLNTGNFFSPGIDANENGVDNFNETFESYMRQNDGVYDDNNSAHYSDRHDAVPAVTFTDLPFEFAAPPQHPHQVSQQPPVSVQPSAKADIQQTPAISLPETIGIDVFDSSHSETTSNNEFLSPPESIFMRKRAYSIEHKQVSPDSIEQQQSNKSLPGSDDNSENENEKYLTRPTIPRSKSDQGVTNVGKPKGELSPNASKPGKKRVSRGAVCSVCDKFISRDLTRHMRIHNEVGRFQCIYPKYMCNHRTQYFNRPYDYKKHLLHLHFKFDDPKGKAAHTLTDKLPLYGTCIACGTRYTAAEWLDYHVLVNDKSQRCAFIEDKDPQT